MVKALDINNIIELYNENNIESYISQQDNNAGVITFNKDVHASYLLDSSGLIIGLNIFANAINSKSKEVATQLYYTCSLLEILMSSIEIISNVTKENANSILNQLDIFGGNKLKPKAVRFNDFVYKIEATNGIIIFSIYEDVQKF